MPNFDKRGPAQYTKLVMPSCHYAGDNVWLLKPTSLNRGRGIHVFKDVEKLKSLIKGYCKGVELSMPADSLAKRQLDEVHCSTIKENVGSTVSTAPASIIASPEKSPTKSSNFTYKYNSFIIQKYIERPLLINKRKFDIRVWVLVTQELECFFFKEGYLRTSSEEFDLNPETVEDQFMHLTNNAVQKYSTNYGQFEDGNQLSFTNFQDLITNQYKNSKISVYNDIVPAMKNIIKKSLLSVRRKLNPENRKFCFEIFGYDFMLDKDFNVWLIEANTNPCIEESSSILKMLIPRMLDDAFKLTIDVVFPKPSSKKRKPSSAKVQNQPSEIDNNIAKEAFSVTGYTDNENMWDRMCCLSQKFGTESVQGTYLKSNHIIHITDRSCKVKKNSKKMARRLSSVISPQKSISGLDGSDRV